MGDGGSFKIGETKRDLDGVGGRKGVEKSLGVMGEVEEEPLDEVSVKEGIVIFNGRVGEVERGTVPVNSSTNVSCCSAIAGSPSCP